MHSDDENPTEPALIRDLDRLAGVACSDCSHAICGHEILCSIALGFKDFPRCLSCLAAGLRQPIDVLRNRLIEYVNRRDCYRSAWDIASDREQLPRQREPSCLDARHLPKSVAPIVVDTHVLRVEASEWDAGDMGCGDLVLALRLRLRDLQPRGAIRVVARDPAAPEDLPAWCRLTGHRLLAADHPTYLIQRKD
jgi:tRNA 2-thiouridine synthesizing protein A